MVITRRSIEVRVQSEYLFIQQRFIQNNISHEKTEQLLTILHSHTEGSGICHNVLSVNVCLQLRILTPRIYKVCISAVYI
jgi:hypothetical protein